jgi:hypothetical protein
MSATGPHSHASHQSFWLWVMCLTGVDYFSTLGYQPSIAFESTGLLAPLATVLLILVTLFGALPVYAYVARESPRGQGSIAMLERLVHGWTGKFLVLVLLGFAATDYVITKTLSAADAAEHLIANPYWPLPHEADTPEAAPAAPAEGRPQPVRDRQRLVVTMLLLVLLGAVFLRGFREAIGIAVVLVGVYLLLNAVILASGLYQLATHPGALEQWWANVQSGNWHVAERPVAGGGLGAMLLTVALLFPKLALGLSGFETGVAVMPLVKGDPGDDEARPLGRIRNTRKLLVTAAVIMSCALLASSLITATLIPPQQLEKGGRAANRALAYLAHGESPLRLSPLFGNVFGTLYDLSTVVILWFAGASAMAGLLNLVPQYLPRYGMAPEWARALRPLVLLFTGINLVVTYVFNADVQAQGGAYATGVLVLITSACVATVIGRWRERTGHWLVRTPWYFLFITGVFVYTTADNVITKPEGIKIASCFIAAIVVSSIVSRGLRSTELRFTGFRFKDEQSRFLWESMEHLEFPVLVPHRPGRRDLASKEESIRREHRLSPDVPIVFIETQLGDVSEFYQEPVMEVIQQEGRFILRITRCASIAHVLAALGLELSKVGTPPELHFGWSDESPLAANIGFLLFGEGNVPWMVRELIRKAEPNPERQPRVIIG